MWNTKRRKSSVNKNRGMKGSLLLVVATIVVVIFVNIPEEQQCMSVNCTNHRSEKSVYCTEHQQEFEEYKSKAYGYENCTITYSTDAIQCEGKHTSKKPQYELGDK